MKNIFLAFISNLAVLTACTQTNKLPIKEWMSTAQTPFVFYITGDGGLNGFSNDLCTLVNASGYNITALDAKSYFWQKKTPGGVASDLSIYLEKIFEKRKIRQWVLVGYSFGADVTPFIVNNLPDVLKKDLVSIVLMSPTTSTDFEIHLADWLGMNKRRSMDVVAGMNTMGLIKTATVFGSDEHSFPLKDIKLKNYNNEILPGGHHFDGNVKEVSKTVMKYF